MQQLGEKVWYLLVERREGRELLLFRSSEEMLRTENGWFTGKRVRRNAPELIDSGTIDRGALDRLVKRYEEGTAKPETGLPTKQRLPTEVIVKAYEKLKEGR